MSTSEVRWLQKIGAGAAILGALCAGVGNVLHPVTPRDDESGVAQVIADSHAWTPIHLVIIAGILMMPAGLLAIRHSISRSGLAGALTRLGMYAVTIGATIGMITLILDGVAAKQLADHWAVASESEKAGALALVSTNETINFALAGLFNASFAGVPFILFGLAVSRVEVFPQWLGWAAFTAGVGSIAAGIVQAVTGEPTTVSLILTIVGPTVIALWMLVMGVFLWRLSKNQELLN